MKKNSVTDELVYDEARLKDASSLMSEIQNDLYEADNLLYNAVMKIGYSKGFDNVERDDIAIDMSMPEKLMIECREETQNLATSINHKIELIDEYQNSIGKSSKSRSKLSKVATGGAASIIAVGQAQPDEEIEVEGELLNIPVQGTKKSGKDEVIGIGTGSSGQLLYGPPPVLEEEYKSRQLLYGPPPTSAEEVFDETVSPIKRGEGEYAQPLYGVARPVRGEDEIIFIEGEDDVIESIGGEIQPLYGVARPIRGEDEIIFIEGEDDVIESIGGEIQPLYGVARPITWEEEEGRVVQPLYGVPTPPTTGVQVAQPLYGVPTPPTTGGEVAQPLYGVPTPPTTGGEVAQPLYGVPTPPTTGEQIAQPLYGVLRFPVERTTSPAIITSRGEYTVKVPSGGMTVPQQPTYLKGSGSYSEPVNTETFYREAPTVGTPPAPTDLTTSVTQTATPTVTPPTTPPMASISSTAYSPIPNTNTGDKTSMLEKYGAPAGVGLISGVVASGVLGHKLSQKKKLEEEEEIIEDEKK